MRKNEISPSLSSLEKLLEKSTISSPGKNLSDAPTSNCRAVNHRPPNWTAENQFGKMYVSDEVKKRTEINCKVIWLNPAITVLGIIPDLKQKLLLIYAIRHKNSFRFLTVIVQQVWDHHKLIWNYTTLLCYFSSYTFCELLRITGFSNGKDVLPRFWPNSVCCCSNKGWSLVLCWLRACCRWGHLLVITNVYCCQKL